MGLFARWKEKRRSKRRLVITESVSRSGREYRFRYDLIGQKGLLPLLRLYQLSRVYLVVFDLRLSEVRIREFLSEGPARKGLPFFPGESLPNNGWAFALDLDSLDAFFALVGKEKASYSSFFVESPYVAWAEFIQEITDPSHPLPEETEPTLYLEEKKGRVELAVDSGFPVFVKGDDIGLVLSGKRILF